MASRTDQPGGRGGRGAPRLTRERILAAALELAARDGEEALSMRRLAQELDVWPMSIYRYFADKEALLDAMAGSAAEEVALPQPRAGGGAGWRDEITALLHEARRALGADPGALAARLPRALLTEGGLRIAEAGLDTLRRAGFAERDAASAWRALIGYTFGFTVVAPATNPAEALRLTRTALAALPGSELWAADELAEAMSSDEEFERGLERLLDGLDAALSRA